MSPVQPLRWASSQSRFMTAVDALSLHTRIATEARLLEGSAVAFK